MGKDDAVKCILNKIYESNSKTVLSKKDVEEVNNQYKKNFKKCADFGDLFVEIPNNKKLKKVKSAYFEIENQYKAGKGLQAGIISECNYTGTLAKMFKLNKCLDLGRSSVNELPFEVRPFMNSGDQTYSCARYLYYNPQDFNVFIFQYGNPAAGDAEIIFSHNHVRLEFKENAAKAGEYDITGKYGEDGKLLISDDFKKKHFDMVPLVQEFNSETDVISQVGHNYSNFNEEEKLRKIKDYFFSNNVNLLISSDSFDNLIALTPDTFDVVFKSGKRVISTNNSEIRTAGRNHTKVFTPEFLMHSLKQNDAEIQGDTCSIDRNRVVLTKARGSDEISRININHVFYVPIKEADFSDEHITFKLSSVQQLVPSISMHMKIEVTKEELKKYYEEKYNISK